MGLEKNIKNKKAIERNVLGKMLKMEKKDSRVGEEKVRVQRDKVK